MLGIKILIIIRTQRTRVKSQSLAALRIDTCQLYTNSASCGDSAIFCRLSQELDITT